MHIETVGQGPDIVLIHGWALHGGVFAPLVARLSPRYRLHLVDLPGHGHSREDDTALALPHVVNVIAAATPPAVWLGWSLGRAVRAACRRQPTTGAGAGDDRRHAALRPRHRLA